MTCVTNGTVATEHLSAPPDTDTVYELSTVTRVTIELRILLLFTCTVYGHYMCVQLLVLTAIIIMCTVVSVYCHYMCTVV